MAISKCDVSFCRTLLRDWSSFLKSPAVSAPHPFRTLEPITDIDSLTFLSSAYESKLFYIDPYFTAISASACKASERVFRPRITQLKHNLPATAVGGPSSTGPCTPSLLSYQLLLHIIRIHGQQVQRSDWRAGGWLGKRGECRCSV